MKHIHDILIRNISIYADEGVPAPTAMFCGGDENHKTENITLRGIFLNGEKYAPALEAYEFTDNIRIED